MSPTELRVLTGIWEAGISHGYQLAQICNLPMDRIYPAAIALYRAGLIVAVIHEGWAITESGETELLVSSTQLDMFGRVSYGV